MRKGNWLYFSLLVLALVAGAAAKQFSISRTKPALAVPSPNPPVTASTQSPIPTPTPTTTPTPTSTPSASMSPAAVIPPIGQFKARITKKFFGTQVSPQNSPISPERFSGYHTGVDIEYSDTTTDVPVFAIADGTVLTSETASGYGGVMVIQHTINNQVRYSIYGHLRASSMLTKNSKVAQGEQIAVLGTGSSPETDGERRHLHFGIATKNTITGYVASTALLNATWIDPLTLYP